MKCCRKSEFVHLLFLNSNDQLVYMIRDPFKKRKKGFPTPLDGLEDVNPNLGDPMIPDLPEMDDPLKKRKLVRKKDDDRLMV